MKKDPEKAFSCSLDECLTMAESSDVQELLNQLKLKTSYYQEETAKMESVFLKLGLIDEQLKMFEECVELTEKLNQLQQQFDLKEVTPTSVALSHADKLRKHNNYAVKIKICIKMYMELNEALLKKVKHLKSYQEQVEISVNEMAAAPHNSNVNMTITSLGPEDELKIIEKKISRYEHELTKLEKKYPWLKNSDYSLPNISKEINLLIIARTQKGELVEELSRYHGLKPNLHEASEQLAQMKVEYEQMNEKLSSK
ncbi:hypothetical protein Zmor_002197 [Zophobas morio]|uniref:Uncharacterized protein n=1 Tax=Zophobas morio TaxID=2755281 RepID=A0AA38J4D7_9CUCU|nr:hypothetical protein Zmor_025519 [Zophobas morio]KAJ3666766.1 hypothetical protein Zmor_002197 [Zophobas morio]